MSEKTEIQDNRLDHLEEDFKDIKLLIGQEEVKLSDIDKNVALIKAKLFNGFSEAVTLLISNQNQMAIEQAKHDLIIRGMLWLAGAMTLGLIGLAVKVWF